MKKYNYAIDFWKIIFCLLIVCLHSNNFWDNGDTWFKGGGIGVEFFFIVTGFLMSNSISSSKTVSTFKYVYNKVAKLFPYVFLTSLFIFIEKIYINNWNLSKILSSGFRLFFSELTFTRLFGFSLDLWNINGASWYLSAMVLTIIFIYPLLSINRKLCGEVIFPIISIALIGYLIQTNGTIIVIDQYSYFTFDGVKRAIAEICFGCTLYELHEKIKLKKFTRLGKIVISFIEIYGYALTVLFAWKNYNDISVIVLIFLGISICITFTECGIITNYLNRIIRSDIFNKFSLSLFLSHMEIMEIFRYYKVPLEGYGYTNIMICYLILSISVSFINMTIINITLKHINKKKIIGLFLYD